MTSPRLPCDPLGINSRLQASEKLQKSRDEMYHDVMVKTNGFEGRCF